MREKQNSSPQEIKRRVGNILMLLYAGYLGLAVYLYILIRGSVAAYIATCAFLGLALFLTFKISFRKVK
jgi:hypothetical protein